MLTRAKQLRPGRIAILGTRGIPAQHGGFETFAEKLALHLVVHGWQVRVACQSDPAGVDIWHGVTRVKFGAGMANPLGTVSFDAQSVFRAAIWRDPVLVLGYNTAIFWLPLRLLGVKVVANMDGIEWARAKWSWPVRLWMRANERLGARLANHIVADHPEIAERMKRLAGSERVTMIPYGADRVTKAAPTLLEKFGLRSKEYVLMIARLEPENSILRVVTAYCRAPRKVPLVILGSFISENPYHRSLREAAGPDVKFLGALYDADVVAALRVHALLYIHGHTVGGTNPAFVEALAAGCPTLAHDNPFNRWVGGKGVRYFRDTDECSKCLDELLDSKAELDVMSEWAFARAEEAFRWEPVLTAYEHLMALFQPSAVRISVGSEVVDHARDGGGAV